MNHKDSEKLSQAVEQYLLLRIEQGYPQTHIDIQGQILQDFCLFVERQPKEWDEIFTLEILKEFKTPELSVRILTLGNLSGSAGFTNGEITNDLFFAVSEFDELPEQNLFRVSEFYNPKIETVDTSDIKKPVIKISYGKSGERQSIRIEITINTLITSNCSKTLAPSGFKNNMDCIISQALVKEPALKKTQVKFTHVKVSIAKKKPLKAVILNGKYFPTKPA